MDNNSLPFDFFENISGVINFFRYTPESGLLFCACNNQRLIRQINQQIIEKAKDYNLNIGDVYISSDYLNSFLPIFRKAASDMPDGFIINNLDELILISQGRFISEINMAREILIELGVPMLFWLSDENISRFANKAPDLFLRRDRSVIAFCDVAGVSGLDRFKDSYSHEYISSEEFKSLNLKIELLEKQLKEAEEKKYNEKRIAFEIVADLIQLYLKAFLRQEASKLFEKYGKYFEESTNIKHLFLRADYYHTIGEWNKALAYYLNIEEDQKEDQVELARTYNEIGTIYRKKGNWDKAFEYLFKSENILIKVVEKGGLISTYNNIGVIYRNKGDWNKSLEYLFKSEEISLEVGDNYGLASIHNNIGVVYRNKSDWDKSFEYFFKSEQIKLKIGDKAGLALTYNNIGATYDKKGDWDKAIEYFIKSENLFIEIGDKSGLAYTYINIGDFYSVKKENEKASEYFILAGYLAKNIGMKHELSEWQSYLDPIIKELGEEKFMEIGKKLYEEKFQNH